MHYFNAGHFVIPPSPNLKKKAIQMDGCFQQDTLPRTRDAFKTTQKDNKKLHFTPKLKTSSKLLLLKTLLSSLKDLIKQSTCSVLPSPTHWGSAGLLCFAFLLHRHMPHLEEKIERWLCSPRRPCHHLRRLLTLS